MPSTQRRRIQLIAAVVIGLAVGLSIVSLMGRSDDAPQTVTTTTIVDVWATTYPVPVDNEIRDPRVRMVFPSGPVTTTPSELDGKQVVDWVMSSTSQVLSARLVDTGAPVVQLDVDREASRIIESLGDGHLATRRTTVDGRRALLVVGTANDAYVFQVVVGDGDSLLDFIAVDDGTDMPVPLRSLLDSVDFPD